MLRTLKHSTIAMFLMLTGVMATAAKADGDLEVFEWQGKLVIFGDDKPNDVVIHSYQPGEFTLTSTSTTFNGKKKLAFSKIQALSVQLQGGDDRVEFRGNNVSPNVPEKLFVFMGSGTDTVIFDEFQVGGDAWMYLDDIEGRGQQGNDRFEAHQLNVYGYMSLQTGGGADEVSFDVEETEFYYNLALTGARIDLGQDSKEGDILRMSSFFTWAGLEVVGTYGDDVIEMLDVQVYEGDLVVALGDGWDELSVGDADMNWSATDYPTSIYVSTDGGQNVMEFENIEIRGDIVIKGSRGRDGAQFQHVNLQGKLSFEGAENDDMLFVQFTEAQFHSLDGGEGDEDLIWEVNSNLGTGEITGFEID